MPVVIMAVRAVQFPTQFLSVSVSPIKNDMPVQSSIIDRNGKVTRSRKRRPYVSIVKNAGKAKIQLRIPVPRENNSACGRL